MIVYFTTKFIAQYYLSRSGHSGVAFPEIPLGCCQSVQKVEWFLFDLRAYWFYRYPLYPVMSRLLILQTVSRLVFRLFSGSLSCICGHEFDPQQMLSFLILLFCRIWKLEIWKKFNDDLWHDVYTLIELPEQTGSELFLGFWIAEKRFPIITNFIPLFRQSARLNWFLKLSVNLETTNETC